VCVCVCVCVAEPATRLVNTPFRAFMKLVLPPSPHISICLYLMMNESDMLDPSFTEHPRPVRLLPTGKSFVAGEAGLSDQPIDSRIET